MTNFFKANKITTKFLIVSTVIFVGLAAFLAYFTILSGQNQINIVYLVIGETGVMWLLFILISSKLLVQKPIERLRNAAFEVTQGNFKKDVNISSAGGKDELSELAGIFNDITLKLRTAQENMEKKVLQ